MSGPALDYTYHYAFASKLAAKTGKLAREIAALIL